MKSCGLRSGPNFPERPFWTLRFASHFSLAFHQLGHSCVQFVRRTHRYITGLPAPG